MSFKVPKGIKIKAKKKGTTLSQCLRAVSNGNTRNRDSKVPRNRARTWCFTLNNYTEEDCVSMSHSKWDNLKIKKLVFQEEMGKKNVKHLQGVVMFEEQISFSSLKKFNSKVHWSKCRDIKASIKYCSKESTRNGEIYTYGDVQKNLWKDESKIELMDHEEMLEDMCKQMKESKTEIAIAWDKKEIKRYGHLYKHLI